MGWVVDIETSGSTSSKELIETFHYYLDRVCGLWFILSYEFFSRMPSSFSTCTYARIENHVLPGYPVYGMRFAPKAVQVSISLMAMEIEEGELTSCVSRILRGGACFCPTTKMMPKTLLLLGIQGENGCRTSTPRILRDAKRIFDWVSGGVTCLILTSATSQNDFSCSRLNRGILRHSCSLHTVPAR